MYAPKVKVLYVKSNDEFEIAGFTRTDNLFWETIKFKNSKCFKQI